MLAICYNFWIFRGNTTAVQQPPGKAGTVIKIVYVLKKSKTQVFVYHSRNLSKSWVQNVKKFLFPVWLVFRHQFDTSSYLGDLCKQEIKFLILFYSLEFKNYRNKMKIKFAYDVTNKRKSKKSWIVGDPLWGQDTL